MLLMSFEENMDFRHQTIFLATWPDLTVDLVQEYLPKSKETVKGRMQQSPKNTRSTKIESTSNFYVSIVSLPTLILDDANNDTTSENPSPTVPPSKLPRVPSTMEPTTPILSWTTTNTTLDNTPVFLATDQNNICSPIDSSLPRARTHDELMKIEDVASKIYTDQNGCFPIMSTCDKKYILVTYDFDSSTINVKHTKSRTGPDPLKAYQTIQIVLEQRGLKTCVHFLDNKCPNILKAFMY